MTCVAPGRLTTRFGQLTLLTSQRARASARQYARVPATTWSVPGGRLLTRLRLTTQTGRTPGASFVAAAAIAAGLQKTPRYQYAAKSASDGSTGRRNWAR